MNSTRPTTDINLKVFVWNNDGPITIPLDLDIDPKTPTDEIITAAKVIGESFTHKPWKNEKVHVDITISQHFRHQKPSQPS